MPPLNRYPKDMVNLMPQAKRIPMDTVAELARQGLTWDATAERVGFPWKSIDRALYRDGLVETRERLRANTPPMERNENHGDTCTVQEARHRPTADSVARCGCGGPSGHTVTCAAILDAYTALLGEVAA